MVNHHLSPPFGRIFFELFPSIEDSQIQGDPPPLVKNAGILESPKSPHTKFHPRLEAFLLGSPWLFVMNIALTLHQNG